MRSGWQLVDNGKSHSDCNALVGILTEVLSWIKRSQPGKIWFIRKRFVHFNKARGGLHQRQLFLNKLLWKADPDSESSSEDGLEHRMRDGHHGHSLSTRVLSAIQNPGVRTHNNEVLSGTERNWKVEPGVTWGCRMMWEALKKLWSASQEVAKRFSKRKH